jgi:hypothetical protein
MKANELKNKKITLATLKSFVKKAPKLFVEQKSSFDGMTDGIEYFKNSTLVEISKENAIGINGVYTVGGSRDYFKFHENEKFFGIEVYNCCGCGILWSPKN